MHKTDITQIIKEKKSYSNIFDLVGIGNSILCLIHCAVLPIIFQGFLLTNSHSSLKKIESLFLISILLWGGISFFRGFFWHHHNLKILLSFIFGISMFAVSLLPYFDSPYKIWIHVIASIIISISHIYNWRYCRRCALCQSS